jgi:hypothetical protein
MVTFISCCVVLPLELFFNDVKQILRIFYPLPIISHCHLWKSNRSLFLFYFVTYVDMTQPLMTENKLITDKKNYTLVIADKLSFKISLNVRQY